MADPRGFAERGGLWVAGQAVLMLGVLAGAVLWPFTWTCKPATWLGLLLLVAGGVCGWLGASALGSNLTPFPQPGSSATLVQSGIYRHIRHPLYSAVFFGCAGFALVFASWPALVFALSLGPFFDAKSRIEETALIKRFSGYREYRKRTRRFVPGVY